jgi:hypothetical protein
MTLSNCCNNRKRRKSYSTAEGLCVFRLTFEPLCYRAGSFLNTVPDSLHRPFDRPLHHRLQGDAGVTAPEAHQHVVSHCLCYNTAFLLQEAVDNLLQLRYFPPCRVQKGKYDAGFRCRVPSPDRVEAKGHQSSVCLAQEAPDTLSVTSSGDPKVFQALLGDDHLLHLPLHQLPLPGRQLSLLVPQLGIPGIRVELTGQDLGTGVL